MKRGKPLRRRTRIKATNPERRKRAFARNFGTRGEAVRAMGCLAAGVWGSADEAGCYDSTQACHSIARGMGGAKGDRRNLVPLCGRHHSESGERGTSQRAEFERVHGLDLQAEAARIAEQLDREGHA
jgi:hypothetical protein